MQGSPLLCFLRKLSGPLSVVIRTLPWARVPRTSRAQHGAAAGYRRDRLVTDRPECTTAGGSGRARTCADTAS
jgi:hypothetical protein